MIALGDALLRSLGLRRYRLELNSLGDEVCRPGLPRRADRLPRADRGRARRRAQGPASRTTRCGCSTARTRPARAVAPSAPVMLEHLCDAATRISTPWSRACARPGSNRSSTPTLVRGLDYYTRTAFEFVSDALQEGGNAQQATLFGGRPLRRARRSARRAARAGRRVRDGSRARAARAGRRRASRAAERAPLDAYVVAIGERGPRGRPARSSRSSAPRGSAADLRTRIVR